MKQQGDEEPDELFVKSEKDQSTLLISKVLEHKEYQKQQETLIVWNEDKANELALSFQESDGCEYIWNLIHQRRDSDKRPRAAVESDNGDTTPPTSDAHETPALPSPELSNLSEVAAILNNAKSMQDKDRLASYIVPENYIDKLLPVFESCEDLESKEDLHKLHSIIKSIIFLNDNTIIEQIIRDETIMGVLGILEYNPATPNMRAKHRDNLTRHANIKPVFPIENETVKSKIQQTLRLKYLKDVILGNALDDSLASILHSLIFFNNIDVINYFESNHEYLEAVFGIFKDEDATDARKKEASKFVIQLCIMSKTVQTSARAALARTLAKHGLFEMFPFALSSDDEVLRTHTANVLASIVELDAYLFREYTIEQTKVMDAENTTLGTVLKRFALDVDPGLKVQYAEIVKASMDLGNGTMVASTMAAEMLRKQDPDTEIYLTVFYDSYCNLFLRPFEKVDVKPIKLDGPIEVLELTRDQSDLCVFLCDLICFVIRQHSFRSKYLMLSTDCFVKIMQLYRCRQAHLKLAALRVFRTCIGLMDEFYTRQLMKFNIFEPTIRVLLDTDGRNNLLNSACLEVLEFIRRENVKTLVEHLITNYGSVLDTINYVSICKMLRLRHEQNMEPSESNEGGDIELGGANERNGQDIGMEDAAAEEEYFNQSSDEEDMSSTNTSTNTEQAPGNSSESNDTFEPLVNYDGSDSSDEEMESEDKETSNSQSPDTTTTNSNTGDPASSSLSPPPATTVEPDRALSPPLRKRRADDDDDEDDVLAARAGDKRRKRNLSPFNASPKKIVINPTVRKLRSNSK
ncbi:component of IIS longevity pathway SMK-1-domain-containing protein [Fennellomyces sp. T-0311]|nr:component of IIS longevity pathway SMK-1-domain-containing protein [Fennellomyces sp. T-0311]